MATRCWATARYFIELFAALNFSIQVPEVTAGSTGLQFWGGCFFLLHFSQSALVCGRGEWGIS
jgi:hypothetical protein